MGSGRRVYRRHHLLKIFHAAAVTLQHLYEDPREHDEEPHHRGMNAA
jgi:hypothetical protein